MNAPLLKPRDLEESPVPEIHHVAGDQIEIAGLRKSFGARPVLKGLDLNIAPGQFVAVIGRSGCGKTTLLRLLSGLDAPTEGTIRVGGKLVKGVESRSRVLFQDARLLPWQTVIGNVGIAREPGWRKEAQQALADVGLADRAHEWPSVLSGGQRQRVALARALVSEPHVLLLDEPFGALDALTRREMHELLLRIWTARRFTTVLITHDVGEALALADRIIVLKDGERVLDVPVDQPRESRNAGNGQLAALHTKILAHV